MSEVADPAAAPELVQEIDAAVSVDLPQHRWDLAMATGQDATIDAEDLKVMWAALSPQTPEWWEFMRTPGRFGPGIEVYGPEVSVPVDAPLQDRLPACSAATPTGRHQADPRLP